MKEVTNVFINEMDKLIHVFVDNEEIKATSEHPFWVVDKGWVTAWELKEGDETLMFTTIGKAILAICILVIFISLAAVIKLTKPVEYQR